MNHRDPLESDSRPVRVDLEARSYEIVIGADNLREAPALLSQWMTQRCGRLPDVRKACLVTDANVAESYAAAVAAALAEAGWTVESAVLEPGENTKRLETVAGLYDRLVGMKADRQTVLLAVGGGVVGDAAGFAAATYARGIPFVQVPTTLLAQVDSSVGGKVGVNHPQGKNLIGAFYQPLGVLIDCSTLLTLPARDYRSGLAEVVKYGVILDEGFFGCLESNVDGLNDREGRVLGPVVRQCCRLKADVVERDEQDRTGLRAVLNYGHTFAHAFEALAGYGTLLHGEAVSVGMVCASKLAERLERIPAEVTARQVKLLRALGLPVSPPTPERFPAYDILERMRLDKKASAERLRFVLPTRLGHVELVDGVPEATVVEVLESFAGK